MMLNGWYESYLLNNPSANNGLVATNLNIKKQHTLRKRLPLAQFLTAACDIISRWSKARDPISVNVKAFAVKPTIDHSLQQAAYTWLNERNENNEKVNKLIALKQDDHINYLAKSSESTKPVTNEIVKRYNNVYKQAIQMKSYDEIYTILFSTWRIHYHHHLITITISLPSHVISETWMQGTCTCPAYLKHHICKVDVAHQFKYYNIPNTAKSLIIDGKKNKGRPALAKKALIEQTKVLQSIQAQPSSKSIQAQPYLANINNNNKRKATEPPNSDEQPKKRGRKPKQHEATPSSATTPAIKAAIPPKKRGRKPKAKFNN